MRGQRVAAWLFVVTVDGAAVVGALLAGEPVVATILGSSGLAIAILDFIAGRRRELLDDTGVADLADRLADQLFRTWSIEASRRGLHQPPLNVTWGPADAALSQPWSDLETLVRAGGGWSQPSCSAAGPEELTGVGSQLRQTWERVPTRRLVVLGEPGCGKTMLLVGLVLDLLHQRGAAGAPVPLLLPFSSFNPHTTNLTTWLEQQMIRGYPWLSSSMVAGVTRARALLDAGLILPVLDGLDELRSRDRTEAVRSINSTIAPGRGLILSCRRAEFEETIHLRSSRPVHLQAATAVELHPLQGSEIARYLTAESPHDGRWEPLVAALTTVPPPPVVQAISTPLMTTLVRLVYDSGRSPVVPGPPCPGELCDTTRFPDRTAVEEHLFDGFLKAAYRAHPDSPCRWTVTESTAFLSFLARYLEKPPRTTSLAWWDIPRAASRSIVLSLAGATVGLAFGLIVGPLGGLATGLIGLLLSAATPDFDHPSPRQITAGRPRFRDLVRGLGFGLVVGFQFGITSGIIALVTLGSFVGLAAGMAAGVISGLIGGLIVGLGLNSSLDARRSITPSFTFLCDRRSTLVVALLVGLAVSVIVAFSSHSIAGVVVGLLSAGIVAQASAWGQFTVARIWMAGRRKLPLDLFVFLSDAYDRGVLRQAGAVWEFRHANLQRHLARRSEAVR